MSSSNNPIADQSAAKLGWKFPKDFWLANLMELCERAAYYGFFILLTVYLTDLVGFDDLWGNTIAGLFAGFLYLLPPFSGAISDRIGFKNGLILAFGLLTIGYFFLGITYSKASVIFFLIVLMVGASFIKPLITGTVAKTSDAVNRARAFSIFYWIVNIGAFSGKTVVPWIRKGLGLEYINFFSAGMSFIALLLAIFLFRNLELKTDRKSFKEILSALFKILTNSRLILLTLIISGFWLIQGQLYQSMPKFVLRMVGNDANPEWLANVNPFIVMVFVLIITQVMRKKSAVNSMLVGMFIMPLSAFSMSLGPWLQGIFGTEIPLVGIIFHPYTIMMIVGIGLQGLAECFISPRFLEFFSLQAPKGEEGVYLGFSHLHSFISYIAGGVISGFLLEKYCPDPKILPQGLTEIQRAAYYTDAHLIWYYFTAIGLISAVALIVYKWYYNKKDRPLAV
ncbi:MAG: MFS transporter [Ignavibacteriaceae bacterium]|nr:MFS transporter [Ignavibacteriaceae bacterium]